MIQFDDHMKAENFHQDAEAEKALLEEGEKLTNLGWQ